MHINPSILHEESTDPFLCVEFWVHEKLTAVCIITYYVYTYIYIQGVSEGIVNILGGGSTDYSE
jgi:hypothetical protein